MKKIHITIILFLSMTMGVLAQNTIEGKWNTGEENGIVAISKTDNGNYEGKLVASDNPKAAIGSLILKEIEKGSLKGKVYSHERGKWYDCQLNPTDSALEITIKAGFIT